MTQERGIDEITDVKGPHYEPFGWHHWPEHPWMSYQFRRALGESQEGGGAVSECFQAASRMVPGDKESWHREWLTVANRNYDYAAEAESNGHVQTAKAAWLRAVDCYRSAEFWLDADDPRRLEVFTRCESSFRNAGRYFEPPVETVRVPYLDDTYLHGYFLRSPLAPARQPVLISFGGLDSFKEELYFMVGRAALARGISCLHMDGPGQGATLRRERITNRFDYEVPVGRCIDYLQSRGDVDMGRIAVSGTSLGGYYAARAASFEHRLAGCISHGAIWDISEMWGSAGEDHGLAAHIKWVFGCSSMAEARARFPQFSLRGVLGEMRCPYLIVHGGHDVLGVRQARTVFDEAAKSGVDVELRLLSADETGAEHCQHDNPTLGAEIMSDWVADLFGITRR